MSIATMEFGRVAASVAAVMTLTLAAPAAAADETASPDRPSTLDHGSEREIDRTWLYTDDARVATPMVLVATTSVSYTSVGNSPSRIVDPFPGCSAPCNTYNSFAGNTATPGGMLTAGGELGLLRRLSLQAVAQVALGGSEDAPSLGVGAIAGLRFDVLPPELRDLHLVVSGGYLREAWQGPVYDDDTGKFHSGSPNGDNGAWIQASISGDIARLRLASTLHGEHVFSDGRDPLDLMVQAGASYRIVGGFRAGLEYVGQDLEESFTPGAEGGARHFLGPIASLQLLSDRLTLVGGPSIGLTTRSPDVLGRIALSYAF